MKQHIVRICLGLLVVLLFIGHAAKFYQVGFISQLDNIIYDARLRFTMPGGVDDRIVILDIDEKSLAVPELPVALGTGSAGEAGTFPHPGIFQSLGPNARTAGS